MSNRHYEFIRPIVLLALIVCSIILFRSNTHGQQIKSLSTLQGKKFTGIENINIDDRSEKVKITHSGGISVIPAKDLTEESARSIGLKVTVFDGRPDPTPQLEELTMRDGSKYSGITRITRSKEKADLLHVIHNSGAVIISMYDLTNEFQKKFHFDPVEANLLNKIAETKQKSDLKNVSGRADQQDKEDAKQKVLNAIFSSQLTLPSYWRLGTRQRQIIDASWASKLIDAGFDAQQVDQIIKDAKFGR